MASLMAAPSGGDVAPRAKSSPATTSGSKKSGGGRKGRGPGLKRGDDDATLGSLGEIVRFHLSWGDLDDFPIIVTDRSNEAKLLASRCWLRKWERTELSFKGVVIYICPPGWEADDFLC